MRIITAKILDPTHLELSQPIPAQPGEHIHISIPDEDNEDRPGWPPKIPHLWPLENPPPAHR